MSCLLQQHDVFYMVRMGEHVHGLYGGNAVSRAEPLDVPRLGGGIATYIDNAVGGGGENRLDHVGVHPGTGRVGDDDFRPAVPFNELRSQDIFHVSCIECRIANAINGRIDFCIFDGFGDILDADDLLGLPGYEVGYGAGARIKVIDRLLAGQVCQFACRFV